MARIQGVNLPDDKRIDYALTLLYGVGWSRASQVLKKTGIASDRRVKLLSEDEVKSITSEIDKDYKIEGALREQIASDIKRLKEMGSYRGTRHARGLPARGQRTRSNARTKRGKRKTVGALKKEVWAKLEQQPKKGETQA